MFYQIFGFLFAVTFVSATDGNETDLTGRFYGSYNGFPSYQQNRCLSRNRRAGKCISLQLCPELIALSKKYSPMHGLQAVSDYACGFTETTVQVCCPDERIGVSQPLIDASRPSNSNNNDQGNFPATYNSNWQGNNPRPYPNFERPNDNFNWPNSNNNFNRPNQNYNFNRPNPNNNFNRPNPSNNVNNNNFNRPNPSNNVNNNNFNRPNPNNNVNNNNFNRPNPNNNSNRPNSNNGSPSPGNRPSNGGIRRPPEATTENINNPNNNGPVPFPLMESTTETTTDSNREPTTVHRNRRLLPETICGLSVDEKILGGTETSLEEYPWMALLHLRYANGRSLYSCGGSLISPRYVLTAAHCIKNPDLPASAIIDHVRLGEYDQEQEIDCTKDRQCSPPPENIDIEERIVHSQYNMKDSTQQNDIALLRLKRPVKFSSYILPICLPLDSVQTKNYDGEKLWTAGWGKTNNNRNSQSSVKLKVDLPVVPYLECSTNYRAKNMILTEKQMCAGGEANRDSCSGDSGGPLMSQDLVGKQFRWHVQGIVSIGPRQCGTAGSPGIYTKVSDFTDWILDNMRE